MNEEIKEILDNLKDEYSYSELDLTGTKWIELKQDEVNILLDYITNLQNRIKELEEINKQHQELNAKLRDELETMTFTAKIKQEAIDSLIKRTDKAIEYIKDTNNYLEIRDYNLNDEVEVLEEPKEIPEKLFFTHVSNYNDQSVVNNNFNNYFKKTQETINEIIDYLESKGE